MYVYTSLYNHIMRRFCVFSVWNYRVLLHPRRPGIYSYYHPLTYWNMHVYDTTGSTLDYNIATVTMYTRALLSAVV